MLVVASLVGCLAAEALQRDQREAIPGACRTARRVRWASVSGADCRRSGKRKGMMYSCPFQRVRRCLPSWCQTSIVFPPPELRCYKPPQSNQQSCLFRFVTCGEKVRYDQQTAARVAGTLPESGAGTRPGEAGDDCGRNEPHPSEPEQEGTSGSGKQSAKAAECMTGSFVCPPRPAHS